MVKIQVLYVENVISRKQNHVQQQLSFFLLLDNIGFDKQVDVFWSGEDGVWHTLPAQYHSTQGDNQEYWCADVALPLSKTQSLPGNIQFSLRYKVFADEYWDNNQGGNYSSEADSGIKLFHDTRVHNIAFTSQLKEQAAVPITIAVDQSFNASKVTVHWTTDHWKTTQKTTCHLKLNHWDKAYKSNARNPNQYSVELWSGVIDNVDSFRLQYSICCENDQKQTLWDNNLGNDFSLQREQLKFLILNLHCYQEENQDDKFTLIAKAIDELDVDIICLQEVAEYWRDGQGDWESNAAKIINDRLAKPFNLYTDWSHLGFDKYREGVAILSRYPLSDQQSRYVSDDDDVYSIHSRKVVMARAHVPYIGAINVFSAHLSWLEDGFEQQFKRLHAWAEEMQTESVKATMLCGDFNITAGGDGYALVVDSKNYDDQYLAANKHVVFESIFRINDAHWQDLLIEDGRIDYLFMNKTSDLQVTSARSIFTEQDYGQVSDHCGYFLTFEPKDDSSQKGEM